MKKILPLLGLLVCTQAFALEPDFPPVKGEYYPTKANVQVVNPHASNRHVTYQGQNIDLFLQNFMVTQLQFPEPPLLVNLGSSERFAIEVIPELNSLFIKPLAEVNMSNLIVTTAHGVYTFILKETPFKSFDTRVVVSNPTPAPDFSTIESLVPMAIYGRRDSRLDFKPVQIVDVNASALFRDKTLSMTLKRVVDLPGEKRTLYWLEVKNHGGKGGVALNERSFNNSELLAVATPEVSKDEELIILPGESRSFFLQTRKFLPSLDFTCDVADVTGTYRYRFALPVKGKVIDQGKAQELSEKLTKDYFEEIRGFYQSYESAKKEAEKVLKELPDEVKKKENLPLPEKPEVPQETVEERFRKLLEEDVD